jgi:hypothetical protein
MFCFFRTVPATTLKQTTASEQNAPTDSYLNKMPHLNWTRVKLDYLQH